MAIKLTNDIINKRMEELYNGEYTLLTDYINNQSGGKLRHKTCGTEFTLARLTRFFNQSTMCPCPNCRDVQTPKTRVTLDEFKNRVAMMYPGMFDVISFEKIHAKCSLKCKSCEKTFSVDAGSLFLSKRFAGCPNCRENKRGTHQSDPNYLENTLKEADDGHEYQWMEPFSGNPKDKHKIKHIKCGHEYLVRPTYFRYGDKIRCPKCARTKSKTENDLYNEIIKFWPSAIASDRTQINPYELDIFIKEKNIAIEYNGLHWHSEKIKGRTYHKKKMEICNKKGIRLIQVFEDEWLEKKDIVISKIKNILGVNSATKIAARKCICKKIESSKEYMNFLDKNHIQGAVSLTCAYGLYYNDTLVAVGGFNKLRNSMNKKSITDAWDMIRYATDINYHIIGGCGKIISNFVKLENCKYIKTLADLRWSDSSNNIYISLGFSESSRVEPRYFYTDGHKRLGRFNFRKDKIKEKFPDIYDEKLTEFEMMDKTYFERIWDAGKITYEKHF